MKKIRKTGCVFLAVCMMLLLYSVFGIPAYAAEELTVGTAGSYSTLTEALAAAKDGDTIILLNDITESVAYIVSLDKTVTIDGGGHTVIAVDSTDASGISAALTLTGSGKFILKDVTLRGGTASASDGKSIGLYINSSSVSVRSGGSVNAIGGNATDSYGLYNLGGTIDINTATGGTAATNSFGVYSDGNSTVNVTTALGGNAQYSHGVYNNNGIVNVQSATGGTAADDSFGVKNCGSGTLNVTNATGGIVTTYVYGNSYGVYNNGGNVNVAYAGNNAVTSQFGCSFGIFTSGGTVYAGTATGNSESYSCYAVRAEKYSTVYVNNAIANAGNSFGVYVIDGGVVNANTIYSSYHSAYVRNTGTINGKSISGGSSHGNVRTVSDPGVGDGVKSIALGTGYGAKCVLSSLTIAYSGSTSLGTLPGVMKGNTEGSWYRDIDKAIPFSDQTVSGDFAYLYSTFYFLHSISGKITDSSGNGLTASLELKNSLGNIINTATAGTDGLYTFSLIPAADDYSISVSMNGYKKNNIVFDITEDDLTGKDLMLYRYNISGKITDSSGAGLAASLQLKDSSGNNVGGIVTAAPDGSYTFFDVPDGAGYTISVMMNGYQPAAISGLDITDADLEGKNLTLNYYTLSGRIIGTDAPDGLAACLQLKDSSGNNVGSAVTAASDGTYTIFVPAGNDYTVLVSMNGYDNGSILDIDIANANTTGKNLTLQEHYSISGKIINSSGAGLAASLQLKDSSGNNVGSAVTAAPDGSYTLLDVPAGAGYTISVMMNGYQPAAISSFNVAGTDITGKDLTLYHTVSGKITDCKGTGLAASLQLKDSSGNNVGSVVTAASDGTYTVFNVPEGTGYTMEVTMNGCQSGTVSAFDVGSANIAGKNLSLKKIIKTVVTITGLTAQDGTYNGRTQTGYTGTPSSSYTGDYEIAYTGQNGTIYTSATAPKNAGDYTVTFQVPNSDPTYYGSTSVNFTIGKATVTATADSKSMTTGSTLPAFTVSYSGIASDDTASSIFSTQATTSCMADGKTAGSYTITATTPVLMTDAEKNYTVATSVNGTLTVSNPSYNGGGGGSSSGGTNMARISSGTDQISASFSVSGGIMMVSVTDTQAKELASDVKTGGTIRMDVSGQNIDAVVVPGKIISAAAAAKLELALPTGTVTLGRDALAAVSGRGDVKLTVKTVANAALTDTQKATLGSQAGSATVVDVNVYAGSSKVSTFGNGTITVSVPYTLKSGESADNITVWFVNDDGTIEPKTASYANGKVTFTTEHLSQYLIVDFPFADVAESAWCYGSVAYAYDNGLFSGTSATTFSPNAAMTRQMIWMALARLDGKTPASMDEAKAWAVENKISDGTNPANSITREQLAAILYRYAQYKGYDITQGGMAIREFSDYDNISAYAQSALGWAVNAGLVQGNDNQIMPSGTATRAQVATILMRFSQNVAK